MTIIAVTLCLALLSVLYTYLTSQNSKIRKLLRKLPGPPQLPIIGNALDFNKPPEEVAELLNFQWPRKYGKRFVFAFGTSQNFTSSDPSDIEKLLSSTVHTEKGKEYDLALDWLGEGLLLSKGSKWSKHRKFLSPCFHFQVLEDFMPTFNKNAKILVDALAEQLNEGKRAIEISEYIALCTLDIICETAMGESIHAQRERESDYVEAVKSASAAMQYRGLRPWLYTDFVWYYLSAVGRRNRKCLKLLHGFTENVIRTRKEEMAAHGMEGSAKSPENRVEDFFLKKKKRAFMDTLLEYQIKDPAALSDDEIREETDTFMFEGQDTTAAALAWTIFLIGSHPECQKKVIEELDSIFGDDQERNVTSGDLAKMKYLECCIKESLRLFPSASFISRLLKEDLVLDGRLTVPAGVNFALLLINVHRNPDYFPQPEAFKPERFTLENSAGRHPYVYVPFSAGPRNCIGQKFAIMEEKVILAHLYRNFRMRSLDKRDGMKFTIAGVTKATNGIRMELSSR